MSARVSQDVIFIHALTPLSPGTGTSIDVIDQPIAREKATSFPFVPGTTVKGVLRAGLQPRNSDTESRLLWTLAFGPEVAKASVHAGALVFADARLLFLPVRSERGVFAWVTCPLVLRRFVRDLPGGGPQFTAMLDGEGVAVPEASALLNGTRVVFEDIELERTAAATSSAKTIAEWFSARLFADALEQKDFRERVAVVSDEAFAYLGQTATEVVARIRIDPDTRTAAEGGLWYEEALPAEALLSCLVVAFPARSGAKEAAEVSSGRILSVLDAATESTWTIGGKETVGRGRVRLARLSGAAETKS